MLAVDFTGFVEHFSYLAVFLLVGVESLGIPLPGETALIAAATLAGSQTAGVHLAIPWVIVAAIAGAIIGDNIGFGLGWWGGYRLLVRYGRYIHLDQGRVKVARYVFKRHGGKVVFFGRFISILRTYAAFLAGAGRMRWPAFLLYNAAGGIVWATGWGLAAFELGKRLTRFQGPADIVLGVAGAVIIIAGIVVIRRVAARLEEVAEREFPGPLEGYPGGRPL